jgi:translation initiation factor IF-1
LAKEELIEMNGVVTEVLPDSRYRVTLENDHQLIAYAGGKMKKNHIRILAGDNVTLELSPYDINNGRIRLDTLSKVVITLHLGKSDIKKKEILNLTQLCNSLKKAPEGAFIV